MGKVRLRPASESSTQKVSNPVNPVIAPVTGDDGGSKDASGVEGTSRDRTTNKAQETKSETNSNRGETGLAVTRGGLRDKSCKLKRRDPT